MGNLMGETRDLVDGTGLRETGPGERESDEVP